MSSEPKPASRTLARGFQLLELVAGSPEGAAVTDVAARAGLDKGTVSRLLSALHQLGYVGRRPGDSRYVLTSKVLVWARSYESRLNLRETARPHLAALRDLTQETVHLAVREGRRLVFVDQAQPDRAVRLASAVGQSLPLHVTAMGRAILGALPPGQSAALVGQLTADPHFAEFVVDLEHVRNEVERARRDGWATVSRDDDVTRVGSAVVNAAGEPVGAISVSAPAYRGDERLEELATHCLAAGRLISAALAGN
ncbi:IclR family transcriptional regulator [Streptomyces sp. NPDC058576]|uniref:IclR family transcriptional regulator n=1 Tax=Streptomyces sp. NPDC058576 TaxID=3346547 RepID=UPI00365BE1AA